MVRGAVAKEGKKGDERHQLTKDSFLDTHVGGPNGTKTL